MNIQANLIAVVGQLIVPAAKRDSFDQGYDRMSELFSESPGFLSMELGQSTDSLEDLTVIHRWESVGSYRKALSRYEIKAEVIPFLSHFMRDSVTVEIISDTQSGAARMGASSLASDSVTFDRGSVHGER
jgi:quinol monooxygenase YgiN